MPRVIAKLSGKLQLQPVLQAGHALCRGKAQSAQPQPQSPFRTSRGGGSSKQTQSPSNQQWHREMPFSLLPERSHSPEAPGAKNSKNPNKRSSSSLQAKQNLIKEQQGKGPEPTSPYPLTSSCQSTTGPTHPQTQPSHHKPAECCPGGLIWGAHRCSLSAGCHLTCPSFQGCPGQEEGSGGVVGWCKVVAVELLDLRYFFLLQVYSLFSFARWYALFGTYF